VAAALVRSVIVEVPRVLVEDGRGVAFVVDLERPGARTWLTDHSSAVGADHPPPVLLHIVGVDLDGEPIFHDLIFAPPRPRRSHLSRRMVRDINIAIFPGIRSPRMEVWQRDRSRFGNPNRGIGEHGYLPRPLPATASNACRGPTAYLPVEGIGSPPS
jgi:hypothetical protein